jgi:co-chaperonin GroES (HSP10)
MKNPYDAADVKVGPDEYLVIDQKNIVATVK